MQKASATLPSLPVLMAMTDAVRRRFWTGRGMKADTTLLMPGSQARYCGTVSGTLYIQPIPVTSMVNAMLAMRGCEKGDGHHIHQKKMKSGSYVLGI